MVVGLAEIAPGQEVQVLDWGIYTAKEEKILKEPHSPTGQARIIRTELAKKTNVIPAVLNTKFGFRFKVVGPPEGTTARLRLRFTFPEMTNPTNGKASSNYEVTADLPVAPEEQGMFWDFVHSWEMRPGKWTMSLYRGDRLLVQKIFTVVEDTKRGIGKPESSPRKGKIEGPANRSQAVGAETNSTSTPAGSHR